MLVLTRRVGEAVKVGEDVTFFIMGVKGNQVRLGIDAPSTIAVDREEIYLRKRRERDQGQPPEKP